MATYRVETNAQLASAAIAARPGDVIELESRTWTNVQQSFLVPGTVASPIIIRAKQSGRAVISGQSYFELGASYLYLEGLTWSNYGDPSQLKRGYISTATGTTGCKISEMVFEIDNQAASGVFLYQVCLRGTFHEVFNCAFLDKKGEGAQMMVLEGGNNRNHNIHHLYFKRSSLGVVSGESLQIGAMDGVETNAHDCWAHHCFFDGASGEVASESLSVKGDRNMVEDIVFVGSLGALSLRDGSNSIVRRVCIDGKGVTNTRGIIVYGTGHTLEDVFVKGIADNWVGGLQIPGSPDGTFVAASNLTVRNYTVYGSKDNLSFGAYATQPTNINLDKVICTRESVGYDRVLFVTAPMGTYTFTDSWLFGTYNVSQPSGTASSDPGMIAAQDGLFIPNPSGSAAGRGCRLTQWPVKKYQTGPQITGYRTVPVSTMQSALGSDPGGPRIIRVEDPPKGSFQDWYVVGGITYPGRVRWIRTTTFDDLSTQVQTILDGLAA